MSLRSQRLSHRLLAVLVLLGVALFVWLAVVAPFVDLVRDRQDEIASLSERLTALRRANARIPALRSQADRLQAKLAAEGGLWAGPSETSVSTGMQSKLRDALAGKPGHIRSTAELKTTDQVGLRAVRVHVVIDGTMATVVHTLSTIEAARPPMFVDNLTIVAPTHITADKPPMLTLNLDVIGYMRKAGK